MATSTLLHGLLIGLWIVITHACILVCITVPILIFGGGTQDPGSTVGNVFKYALIHANKLLFIKYILV